jgi:hypothetical protein
VTYTCEVWQFVTKNQFFRSKGKEVDLFTGSGALLLGIKKRTNGK